ncbi:tRNA-dihydrouridine synthase family protein [Carboxylicivirga mesophila]|uniref:tRNA-dihydrouridine synthase n=2 Tax=Carboxylicivirga mesophila TaxID=1166478 RepID=A0ABS5KEA0_9BACT|nr:tRNA-dihydrouridine synthase family protein [Carboxylicivirga mesophila]
MPDDAMKTYMAPLQSYTTAFYRLAHARAYGKMDKYFTPFFEENKEGTKGLELYPELSEKYNAGLNCIPQVVTNQADFLINFARQSKEIGYQEININMGCPFPMLVKRRRGGGILKHPELIQEMLESYFKQEIDVKVSVKMRMGTDSPEQGKTIVKLLNNFPLEELILHPRLVTQKYNGQPDWQAFGALCELSHHKIIANGDITSTDTANSIIENFPGINGIMIGRGLLMQPELPFAIRGIQYDQSTLFDFHDHYFRLILDYYQEWNRSFNFLQNFWHYPLQTSQNLKRLYRQLKKHNKPDSYQLWLTTIKKSILQ